MNVHCTQYLCKLFTPPFLSTPGLKSEDPVGREAFKVAIWKTYWRYRVTGTEEQVHENIFLYLYLFLSMGGFQKKLLWGISSLLCL